MNKRNHFVSQVYLRRFAASDGQVWVYDKKERRSFSTSSINIAHEKGFYDLPPDRNFPGDDPEIIEKQLAVFESEFVTSMNVVVRMATGGAIASPRERMRLAKTIAFQHFRTRSWRDRMSAAYKSLHENMLNTAWQLAADMAGQKHDGLDAEVDFDEDVPWALQARAMWSDDTLNRLAEQIFHSVWIIVSNESDCSFVTSDTPVAVQEVDTRQHAMPTPSDPLERYILVEGPPAPGATGTQSFFPVSPHHALLLLDRSVFPEAVTRHGRVLVVREGAADHFNSAQVSNCQRWIYSSSENSAQVEMLTEDVDIRRFHLP